ncbi:tRNA (adenosine(37)-N6)-threonylcarbamoyltransferase complex transferase subunit TsaD [Enterobacteriaceae endosymbiont of Macroplea mutica]|uniref:tRNA (adenosine(37)-N6)-threonylcarbamoyltransferase complex transferase subunit TsaD n=1 Tax=Enterobacteriaceae endosymbiont of Macroplea mutica TaxID=2675791 RepID=UPI001449DCED|nr:tRNA (adenosine(37)-N6)-threonylcarbamoyltransferase complex transferase subunit TsaD [Enterobacteriaceae endosymbiont of Macroplea mutica]QJC31263.1 tRNA (adenosine(37)-N6)-threonylcarbamoyltransferase complex transferase subunit TsaD [Enterobacteriaceae endosymbiont of Macroplea mutica]
MLILGIETSCDDTAIAIYDNYNGILCNHIKIQKIHNKYGGIIPEIAARYHLKNIITVINKVLKKTNKKLQDIGGIAYTCGPGLINSLIVGATIGHALAFSLNIPIIPINHMEGHLLSIMLSKKKPSYPFLGLLISGGHTQLIYAYQLSKYKIIGTNIDDAIGEVYDKVSKFLKLQYIGGKYLSKIAKLGIPCQIKFPRPMTSDKNNFNFSFSGIKTAVKKFIDTNNIHNTQTKANIAYAFEEAVIETLFIKSFYALKKYNISQLVIAGGVSSNHTLRKYFYNKLALHKMQLFMSKINYCIDNAAMIAYVGMQKIAKQNQYQTSSIIINPKLTLHDIIK